MKEVTRQMEINKDENSLKNSMKKIVKYVMGKSLDICQEEISSMLFWASLVA